MPSGSAYQALILPPPRKAPPPAQGGTGGPPTIVPRSPSTTYSPGAIQSHFAPAQAPSHGSFSSAGVPQASQGVVTGLPQAPSAAASRAAQAQKAVQRVEAVAKFAKLLSQAPKLWDVGASSNAFDINPLGKGWQIGRTDMGVDANAAPGTPILAPNDSKVVGYNANWYAGQPYELLQLTKGPNAGKYYYAAEQITSLPPVGTTIKQGQPIARYASSGTGIEMGWGTPTPGQTLAQAQGNTGDASHNNAPAGVDFVNTLIRGGKAPGNVPPAGTPKVARGSAKFVSAITGKPVPAQQPQQRSPLAPLLAKAGPVQGGKISWFGGPNDPTSGPNTASGAPVTKPGVAVYNQQTLGGYYLVKMPNGKEAVLQQTDIGPAPWTGRKMDFTYSSLPALGYTEQSFPTDGSITYRYLGKSVPSNLQGLVSGSSGGFSGGAPAGAPAMSSVSMAPSGGGGGTGAVSAPAASGGASPSAVDQTVAQILGTGTSPQNAQQQQQLALLQAFLSGSKSSPWDIGPSSGGFGGGSVLSSLLPSSSSSSDLGSLALGSLQKLAGNVPLVNPRKRKVA